MTGPAARLIAPCLPTSAPRPPSGEHWLHEIKYDGFRVIARERRQPGEALQPAGPRPDRREWRRSRRAPEEADKETHVMADPTVSPAAQSFIRELGSLRNLDARRESKRT
jgi:hypothetical protein